MTKERVPSYLEGGPCSPPRLCSEVTGRLFKEAGIQVVHRENFFSSGNELGLWDGYIF